MSAYEPSSSTPTDPAGDAPDADIRPLRDRLPESFKAELLEKKLKAEAEAEAVWRESKNRWVKVTALGAAASAGIGLLMEMDSVWGCLALAVTGGGAAWLVVRYRRGHLGGILVYGCSGIAMTYLVLLVGVGYQTGSLLLAWPLYLIVGALLAIGSDPDRSMTGMK